MFMGGRVYHSKSSTLITSVHLIDIIVQSLKNCNLRNFISNSPTLRIQKSTLELDQNRQFRWITIISNVFEGKTLKLISNFINSNEKSLFTLSFYRAHLNDLENIPFFILSAFFYVLTNPDVYTATTLFKIVALTRFLHTFVYAVVVVPQPARFIAFVVPYVIMFYMCFKATMHFWDE